MDQGKVTTTILKRSVMSYLKAPSPVGVDSVAFTAWEGEPLMATSVGTGESLLSYELAVIKACNNIWISGGKVDGLMVASLVPATAREIRLKELTQAVLRGAKACHTKVLGGHTEVSDALQRCVVTITALGHRTHRSCRKPQAGDAIVMAGYIGLEHTALLYDNPKNQEILRERFAPEYLEEVSRYASCCQIEEMARIAYASLQEQADSKEPLEGYLHDISGGGIFAALWELTEYGHCGCEIDLTRILIRQPAIEVMEVLGGNIYKEASAGGVLVATPVATALVQELKKNEIPACIIGQITANRDKIIRNGDETRFLDKT